MGECSPLRSGAVSGGCAGRCFPGGFGRRIGNVARTMKILADKIWNKKKSSYLCTRNRELQSASMCFSDCLTREYSSAGSEHLPYKQRVRGSNPCAPTRKNESETTLQGWFFLFEPG